MFTWTPDKCQFVVKAATWPSRTQGRGNRIYRAHPNVPSSQFTHGKQQKRLFVTQVPWHDRAWTCAKCHEGLQKGFSDSSVWEVATAHLIQCSGIRMRENRAKLSELRISPTKLGFILRYKVKKYAVELELRRAQLCRETGRQLALAPLPRKQQSNAITCAVCASDFACFKALESSRCQGRQKRFLALAQKSTSNTSHNIVSRSADIGVVRCEL